MALLYKERKKCLVKLPTMHYTVTWREDGRSREGGLTESRGSWRGERWNGKCRIVGVLLPFSFIRSAASGNRHQEKSDHGNVYNDINSTGAIVPK